MNERTSLFLMCNLGIEMQRLFSCDIQDTEQLHVLATRSKQIISQIAQKDDMKGRYMEIEKLSDIIFDRVYLHKLSITKEQVRDYFQPFILRNMATHAIL
jgi:stage III sporulation protein SpoIIIAA